MISLRACPLAAAFVLSIVLPGCQSLPEGGESKESGLVSTRIEFVDRYDLERAIVVVFRSNGFQFTGHRAAVFSFHRSGDAASQADYGEWFGPGTQVRVDVVVAAPEFGEFRVRCHVYAIPPGSTQWTEVQEGKPQFRKLLKQVKKLSEVM